MRPLLLVLALAVVVYAPSLGGGLLTDDFVHIGHLETVRGTRRLMLAPDTFYFYRPLTQASLKLETLVYPERWSAFRAANLALHLAVLVCAFGLAAAVLPSRHAAFFATLAFALTPKAHPTAVLWLSARGELLMALFALLAALAWVRWSRGAGRLWLAASAVAYVLALASKEAAYLLPFALLLTPRATRPTAARALAFAGLLGTGAVLFAWRTQVGAVMPTAADGFYNFGSTLSRWVRNGTNYAWRMVPAPLALVLAVGIPARLAGPHRPYERGSSPPVFEGLAFPLMWTAVFLAPVLPIVARNELYLYMPVFGVCLLAGLIVERLAGAEWTRGTVAGTALVIAVMGGYQVSRTAAIHEDLVFSARLVDALRTTPGVRDAHGVVAFVPGDDRTARFLQDSAGGYTDAVLTHALGRGPMRGARDEREAARADIRLRIVYADGVVAITRERADSDPATPGLVSLP